MRREVKMVKVGLVMQPKEYHVERERGECGFVFLFS